MSSQLGSAALPFQLGSLDAPGGGGSDTTVSCLVGDLSLDGLSATVTASTNDVTFVVRAPYLTTDTIGTKTFQVYDIESGVLTAIGSAVTTGFSAIPNISNGWWAEVTVTANGEFGDFYGLAVFSNINGSAKAAVELYSPPTSVPDELVVCKIAPFLSSDTIGTVGYQLYDEAGDEVGSHVTSGIVAITGVTNGYATNITLTPDSLNGAQRGIVWDG